MTDTHSDLGIGMVGYAFMGAAHSQAWRTAPAFFDLPLHPRLRAICGRNEDAAGDVARRFGWESVETDWRALLTRDDIDVIDICTPGNTHAEIAIAALEAGKHVLCEKPLANTVAEAEAMAAAADRGRQARRTRDGRLHLPAYACRRRSRGSSSRRDVSARSATSAGSTSRTG